MVYLVFFFVLFFLFFFLCFRLHDQKSCTSSFQCYLIFLLHTVMRNDSYDNRLAIEETGFSHYCTGKEAEPILAPTSLGADWMKHQSVRKYHPLTD